MKFLLDENLSPRICSRLDEGGHEAVHVRDLGLAGASDLEVLARAADDGHVVITADTGDFGRELAATRATKPSILLLRQLPAVVRAADIASLLLANLTDDVTSALTVGAFVVLTPQVIRVRYLPIR